MMKFAALSLAAAVFAIPAAAGAQAFVQAETGLDVVSVDGESRSGLYYGGTIGYDLPLSGGMFVGIQGTVADSTTKECERDFAVVGDRACIRTGRDLAAAVRLGTQAGDRTKLYVLGGYTNARIRATYSLNGTTVNEGENGDGFRLGAGAQYDLSEQLFVKAEYRYSNYESDFSRHNVLVALGAQF